ncbi:MAG: chemotaxis response regulator protein-glutamate methylesterase [Kofleriaceae bacterium]
MLVVDDSAVVRRLVGDALAEEPDIEIVATAANGKLALERLERTPCDLVTLDVEMPELDGLQTLGLLRKKYPKLPVIMFSSQTSRAAAATIDALSLGANDYVTKPEGGLEQLRECIELDLIPKIKALCFSRITVLMPIERPESEAKVTAVAIGVSTGGPQALHTMLAKIAAPFTVPIFIVQHMPATFTSMLASRLAATSPLPVHEVVTPTRIEPGHVYLARGDHHLVVERGVVHTNQDPPERSCRPSVDVMFRSVAAAYGAGCLGVVMTGMGNDGTRGAEAIRARGGTVIVQDQASSVVWGMPGAVARAGYAHAMVPLDDLAGEIQRRVRARFALGSDRLAKIVRE